MNYRSDQDQSQKDSPFINLADKNIQKELHNFTNLVNNACGTSAAIITLLKGDKQVVKSSVGLNLSRISTELNFLESALGNNGITVLENLQCDDRFAGSTFLDKHPKIKYYAACPIKDPDGTNAGIICVLGEKPNSLTDKQKQNLFLLAQEASEKLASLRLKADEKPEGPLPLLKNPQSEINTILNSASDSIVILDQKGTIIQFNSAAEKVFQYSKKEIIGRMLGNTILPDKEYGKYHQGIYRYYESGNSYITGKLLELSAQKKDGTEFPVELIINRIQNTHPPQFIGILRDISERRDAQLRLKHTLTTLNIGQQLANLGSWRWKPKSNKVEWSERVYDIYEIDIVKKPSINLFVSRVHPDDKKMVQKEIEKVLEIGEFHNFEHRLKIPGKDIRWVRHSGKITFDAEGNPEEINGAVQDITTQKRTQIKLEREKKLGDKIINSLPVSFFMFDREGNAIRWNDEFRSTTGYNEQQIAYMNPTDYFADEEQDTLRDSINNVFQTGEAVIEANIKNSNGDLFPHILSATRFESKGEYYMIGAGQNIAELKKYQLKLQQSLNEKEILLSEIHHRVKNNLAIISSLLHMETFEAEHTRSREALQSSQMRIHSMAMVHEMLYQAGNFNNVPFDNFMKKITKSIKGVYQKEKQDITFDTQADNIKLNVNQAIPFGLIINELLTNSYKHAFVGTDRGSIKMKLRKSGKTISLKVTDNGCGLPEDFSLETSTTIGFTLIKILCQQLDASINIESKPGTKVSLSFLKRDDKGSSSSITMD